MNDFNILSSLSRSSLKLDPFPHFVLNDVFPSSLYSRLDNSFPESFLTSGHPSVVDDRGHTRRLLYRNFSHCNDLDPVWNTIADIHTSADFFDVVVSFFLSQPIDSLYPKLRGKLSKLKTVLRSGDVRKDIGKCLTDFQLVMNNPLPNSGTSRSAHLDNPQQLFALLFYMRKQGDTSIGGGLNLYSATDSAFKVDHGRNRSLDESYLIHADTLHYSSNTAILFLNTRYSYHGVQPIFNQNQVRRSVNIIGELPPGARLFDL